MARILSAHTLGLTAKSASSSAELSSHTRPQSPAVVTDLLSVSANATLHLYLSDLFQKLRWEVDCNMSFKKAAESVQRRDTAVVVCEEDLPDGSWISWVSSLRSTPNAPELIVIGDHRALRYEVMALGGFDALIRPLRETDVIDAVTSAWRYWQKRFQHQDDGGVRCSDA
ncbi:MAG: hypothetical protein ABFD89_17230 [Bryobacteraceae bacterium]